MKVRLISIIVCAALLLTVSGCGLGGPRGTVTPASTPAPKVVPATGDKTYFQQVWHGDRGYREMEYEHYEREMLDEYLEPIYSLAENGGTEDEFTDADFYLTDELYYIQTQMTLISLAQSANPEDEELASELLYAQEMYYTAWDEYWNAMHAMAVSPNAGLMSAAYGDALMTMFEEYEPREDDSDLEAYNAENALIAEYYRLMAQPEPDTDAVGQIFLELVRLRGDYARASGYANYADYAYDSVYSRDYTPGDARALWQGVREYVVPAMNDHAEHAYNGTEFLLSSGAVDCSSRAIIACMDSILPRVSPELYDAFRYMVDYGLYDIEPDPAKTSKGYTTVLYYDNEPFIFNAAYDEFYDYTDMFHEFGHFVNYFYTMSDLLFGYSDYDLSELQSQGMELLFTHFYDEIFGEYAAAARVSLLMDMVYGIVDGALYDEFLQRVYGEDDLTLDEVNSIYAGLYESYGYVPYDGFETEWMWLSHNFDSPFYYISYSVSALAALELYGLMQESWQEGVDKFLTLCAMDTEYYYYSEALSEAGLSDIFDMETCKNIAEVLDF